MGVQRDVSIKSLGKSLQRRQLSRRQRWFPLGTALLSKNTEAAAAALEIPKSVVRFNRETALQAFEPSIELWRQSRGDGLSLLSSNHND